MCCCIAARAAAASCVADRLEHGLVLGDGRAPGRHGSRSSRPGARTAGRGARPRSVCTVSSSTTLPQACADRGVEGAVAFAAARTPRSASSCMRSMAARIASICLRLALARGQRGDLAFDHAARADQLQRAPFGRAATVRALAVGWPRRLAARRRPSRCAPRPSLRPPARSAPRAPKAGSRPAAWPGRARPAGALPGCELAAARSARAAARRSAGTGAAVRRSAGAWRRAAVKGCPELAKWSGQLISRRTPGAAHPAKP